MKLLHQKESQEAVSFFDEAAKVASSSLCLRAKCGSVIVKDGMVIGAGFNSPPQHKQELGTCHSEYNIPAGFRHDRTCCIHAEQRAIADALSRNPEKLVGSCIYFVRIDGDGEKAFARDVKCTVCSRAVLDAGIAEFALWCQDGIRVYDAIEFDRLSYEFKTPRID